MKFLQLLLLVFLSGFAMGQNYTISGTVTDEATGEPLPGANIVFADNPGKGTAADFDGKFSLKVNQGVHKLIVSFVGYPGKNITVEVSHKDVTVDVAMKSRMLQEVEVVSDVAIDRKTPIAFMNIKPTKIEEELAGRDLPMILNTTPGVYATQKGGGEGDAEIRMRGFGGEFIGVLLDGIPVNDMENGTVYWSNWFGINSISRSMQVQRGLGSSKLAIPSVGGTVNIMTQGIESKLSGSVKQSIDEFGKSTTNVGFNSGKLPGNWSFTMAGSYKTGKSWVDGMESEAYFYFMKVNKRFKNHTLSLTAYGAPQWHVTRSRYDMQRISVFDKDYAEDLDINPEYFPEYEDMGIGFNQSYGYIRRTRYNENAEEEKLNLNTNEYFKPMFYLKDYWVINEQLEAYGIGYLSLGNGGGTGGLRGQNNTSVTLDYDDETGLPHLQPLYDDNTQEGLWTSPVDPTYSDTEYRSRAILPINMNNHIWYGALANLTYKYSDEMVMDAGFDVRKYEGSHYSEISDLLGGDYFVSRDDDRIDYSVDPKLAMVREGDKINFYNKGHAEWAGTYLQGEYSTPVFSALLNITGSTVNYKREDFFGDTASDWRNFKGWTVKGGFNYNFSESMNAFVNMGYYNKVQMLNYVFNGYTVNFNENADNERIKSIEVGYQYKSKIISVRVNGYLTRWENTMKRLGQRDELDGNYYSTYVGLDANHMGVEVDYTLKPIKQLEITGWGSLGDWTWDSKFEDLTIYYNDGFGNEREATMDFNVKGLYVSDAAQTQFGTQIRYMPMKGMYASIQGAYNARYYADFDPADVNNPEGDVIQSWQVPEYTLFDFHAGYKFDLPWYEKIKMNINFSVLNIFDTKYISDAENNATPSTDAVAQVPQNFDAAAATVFFGPPRIFRISLGASF
ncbi:MAG: carboxypeptidase-like regulatory domain-containing protein [Salinivirgaceae bacterium]|jgi:iron complex outermembrane receptor protein|nr:carboxypeptidase-like regulatory domain-containing protein [Salinivirgaceae bacterium]